MKRHTAVLHWCAAAIALTTAAQAWAQYHEVDPAASKAFEKVVRTYRALPGLSVETQVQIKIEQDGAKSKGDTVEATFLFGNDRRAVVKLRDFVSYIGEGKVQVIHEKTDDSYYNEDDDDSPYYTLLSMFRDMPFPHLAIMLGEDSVEDLWMQLHPKAPWIRPTAVETIQKQDTSFQRLTFSSDNAVLEMDIRPETKLIDLITLRITDGMFVQRGATMTYTHDFTYLKRDKPFDDKVLTFDPGNRQRVDGLAALIPAPEPQQPGEAVAAGDDAPPLTLATLDGGAIDLSEYAGEAVVVLDFWATWCQPCIAALPKLHEVQKWAEQKQLPVQIITVNCFERGDENQRNKTAKAFWNKHEFTLPVAMDFNDETAAAYGVRGIPATFIIRSDGVIHTRHSGFGPNYKQQLQQDIREAIKVTEIVQ